MAARARSRPCCRRRAALNHELSDPSLAPASFGPFRVLHQIGVGVLGPVYRAQDGVRDQLVAVKVFKVDAPPEQAEQIADALQAVVQALPRHNGLIELIAAGVERDTAYLVMTHSDVLSLDTRLKPGVPLDAEEALTIIRTLAEAMDAAHARGIVHGGLHPRDVFVDERGACRAAGFGVATALARAGVRVPVRRPYSPPERLTTAPIEPAADRFALGAMAFELISGRRIVGTGAAAAARASAPLPDADLDKLQTAFAAMLAENPAHRPATAAAFAHALQQALFPRGVARGVGVGASLTADRDRAAASARDERVGAAGAMGAAAMAGAGAAFLTPPGEADGPSSDDLERFARQGTLWEANGVSRGEPVGDRLRWETVEDVTQGVDPLALFAPESPSTETPAAASGTAAAEDFIGDGDRMDTTRRDSILGLSSLRANAPAFQRDVDDVDGAADDKEAHAQAAGDDVDEVAIEHVPAPREREPGVAPPYLRVDPEERVEQAADASREPGVAPPFLRVERDDRTDAPVSDAPREPGFAPPFLRTDRDDPTEPEVADAPHESEVAPPYLHIDHDDLIEPHQADEGAERSVFFDAQAEEDESHLPAAAAVAGVAAAAGVSARPRIDQEAADRAGEVNAWNRDADADADDGDEPYEDDLRRAHASSTRSAASARAERVVPPAAAAHATAPVVASNAFMNPPEPADVGSPVRVIGLVLALGLAVGGAGGYLLGQRGSLRGPSAIERAEPEGGAPSATQPGGDAAASDPTRAATPSGTPGAADPRAGSGASAASDRTRDAGASGSGAGRDSSNASRAGGSRAQNGATGAGAVATGRAADANPSRAGAATGRLTVTSTPSYAEVAIDGVRRGATPLTVRDLSPGAHTVRVTRTGYAPETRRVTIAAGSASSALTFELEPTGRRPPPVPPPASQAGAPPVAADQTPPARGSAAGLGALYIVSRPMGAQVKVDGRAVGATPLLVTDVTAGSHSVQIEAPGHKPWSTTVQVTAGQRVRVGASLEEGSQD